MNVDFSSDLKSLLVVISSSPLLPQERDLLTITKSLEENQNFDQVYEFEDAQQQRKLTINLPVDAATEKIEREDHDTPFGCLVEITLPKRVTVDPLKLKARKFTHFAVAAKTTTALTQREAGEQQDQQQQSQARDTNNINGGPQK